MKFALLLLLLAFAGCTQPSRETAPTPEPMRIEILSKTVKPYGDDMFGFIGEVRNAGSTPLSGLVFTISAYDKSGKLLDTGSAMLKIDNLSRGQNSSFEAVISGIPDFSTYKLEITDLERKAIPYTDRSKN